jgi:hypothetical protein
MLHGPTCVTSPTGGDQTLDRKGAVAGHAEQGDADAGMGDHHAPQAERGAGQRTTTQRQETGHHQRRTKRKAEQRQHMAHAFGKGPDARNNRHHQRQSQYLFTRENLSRRQRSIGPTSSTMNIGTANIAETGVK